MHSPVTERRSQRPRNQPESSTPGPPAPRRSVRVYNDDMTASSQPQTPHHLPDARHRSRFHPSYTAPAVRFAHIQASPRSVDSVRARRATLAAGSRSRSDSPAGLDTPGFEGLYGGQENTDEQVLFNRAARRLWLQSETRRRARSRSGTPERELRIGGNQ